MSSLFLAAGDNRGLYLPRLLGELSAQIEGCEAKLLVNSSVFHTQAVGAIERNALGERTGSGRSVFVRLASVDLAGIERVTAGGFYVHNVDAIEGRSRRRLLDSIYRLGLRLLCRWLRRTPRQSDLVAARCKTQDDGNSHCLDRLAGSSAGHETSLFYFAHLGSANQRSLEWRRFAVPS